MSQKYELNILSKVVLLRTKQASIPVEYQHQLALADGRFLIDPEMYRRLVAFLLIARKYWVL